MNDKEKLLISLIIIILGAVISYRIGFVDNELFMLEERIKKVEAKNP